MTADTCATCGHQHSGDQWGGICIGCPCEERLRPPAPTTESVDDYEGWVEVSFLPSVKYAVVWDEARDGWRVLTLDDGGAFA